MKQYLHKEARDIIGPICRAAAEGAYPTRDTFISLLEENPHIAVQGYNSHGKIFYWNDAAAHLYGHSEAAAVNQDLFELILPAEMRTLARDMVMSAAKTGKMPDPSPCDLVRYDGSLVTVLSGHLVFKWEKSYPEFYCIDLPLKPDTEHTS